ncbi:MAG: zinc-ribbon domain-containing protein [Candidatus Bathyarchaeia archaeon]
MPYCPNCGNQVSAEDNFCSKCGFKLKGVELFTPEQRAVMDVVLKRVEAIRNRDPKTIEELVDKALYTKFDDWPPFTRLEGEFALNEEAKALKVLVRYEYEVSGWRIDILGDVAVASFYIAYRGRIRRLDFDIRSRVSTVLIKRDGVWRIVHEHFSRIGEKERRAFFAF